MSKISKTQEIDGRRQRTERSRTAIINAALELIEEGILIATAQQITDRANVGIRTFFRHFEDMGALAQAVDESIRGQYEATLLNVDRSGSLDERILNAVERHALVYEKNYNIILATAAQRWRLEVLRKNYARVQKGLRKDLDNWLPELKKIAPNQRESIDAIASFELWHRLREHQGLTVKASVEVISGLLKNLMQTT
ncbi:MAG: AcrR family transcriptional regulator [Zhongshania sp.]|jgi:AcrR family transcriptional regulator